MPNTIAHIAVQTLVTRGLLQDADFKWILAGCVLPDIPWIIQRVVAGLAPDTPAIPLRLYSAVQSSLIITLILGLALALVSRRPMRTFAILAIGITLHLLLDATQTKWANGALFFAPFSWEMVNFGLYWPESPVTMGLSVVGLVVALHALWKTLPVHGQPVTSPGVRPVSAVVLILAWLILPILFTPAAKRADLHYAATLDADTQRVGASIEFDRALLQTGSDGTAHLRAWTDETFNLRGIIAQDARVVSVRGIFIAPDTVRIEEIFVHKPGWRAILSQMGLLFCLLWWVRCLRPAHWTRPD